MDKVYLVKEALEKLTNKKRTPLLFIGKNGITPTLDVRKYTSTKEANKYLSAMAILVLKGNIAHSLFGNMILNIDKRPMPTKLFINEGKAISWLQTFIEQ